MDDEEPMDLPIFLCENCGGQMYLGYYEGVHDIKYRLSEIL
jgi:hypothetical protein